jgi:hypothetical protein
MGILDQSVIPVTKEKKMKNFFKKLIGIDKIEAITNEAEQKMLLAVEKAEEAKQATIKAEEESRLAKLSPKELATEKKEPWIAVLDTHVNKDNIRNGFFELDWNEYFVLQLRGAGYVGESDEAIVDQWFSELCRNVGGEAGVSMDRRGMGYVNVNNLGGGKSEIG